MGMVNYHCKVMGGLGKTFEKVTHKKPGSDPTWYTLLQRFSFPGP